MPRRTEPRRAAPAGPRRLTISIPIPVRLPIAVAALVAGAVLVGALAQLTGDGSTPAAPAAPAASASQVQVEPVGAPSATDDASSPESDADGPYPSGQAPRTTRPATARPLAARHTMCPLLRC